MSDEDVFMNSNGRPGTDQSKALFDTANAWYPTSISGDSQSTCIGEMNTAGAGRNVPNLHSDDGEK
jgi:hypothetical protein